MAWYIDTSALVKLVSAEPETHALLSWLRATGQPVVCSDLARTELMRAVRRVAPETTGRVREVLDSLVLLAAPPSVFDSAGRLEPPSLSSLDAIHIATALELGDDLDGIVSYDERLNAAARSYGLEALSPD